jgi:hypothetical protein
MLQLRAAE